MFVKISWVFEQLSCGSQLGREEDLLRDLRWACQSLVAVSWSPAPVLPLWVIHTVPVDFLQMSGELSVWSLALYLTSLARLALERQLEGQYGDRKANTRGLQDRSQDPDLAVSQVNTMGPLLMPRPRSTSSDTQQMNTRARVPLKNKGETRWSFLL